MNKLLICVYAIAICAIPKSVLHAAETSDNAQIEKNVRAFFLSTASRDLPALRAVLNPTFIVVEAGDRDAIVHVVDRAIDAEVLPPKGNNDLSPESIKLSNFKITIPASNPTVAMVSFTLAHPLNDVELQGVQDVLKNVPLPEGNPKRQFLQNSLTKKMFRFDMFAILAKQKDKWAIACLSVPK